jgi:hypothetical protein
MTKFYSTGSPRRVYPQSTPVRCLCWYHFTTASCQSLPEKPNLLFLNLIKANWSDIVVHFLKAVSAVSPTFFYFSLF